MRWRRDGEDPLYDLLDPVAEFGDVQDLEGSLRVADEINFRSAGSAFNSLDEVCDFVRGCCDGFEAADEGEEGVFSIGRAECTVPLLLEVKFEVIYVFVVGGAEAVEEDDGVWVGFAAAGIIVVDGDGSFDDWG